MGRSKIAIILPANNEAKHIRRILTDLKNHRGPIIVVDDGSKDETAKIARRLTKHVLIHKINLGKGAALKTGCEYAFGILGANAVIFMDSDGQHRAEEIPKFVKTLQEGHQVIFGVRRLSGTMPVIRRWTNEGTSHLIKLFFGKYIPDIPSGFKAVTRKAYQKIKWGASGYEVETEIAARVAKQKIPFAILPISTVYLDYNRGITFLDAVQIIMKVLSWRIRL